MNDKKNLDEIISNNIPQIETEKTKTLDNLSNKELIILFLQNLFFKKLKKDNFLFDYYKEENDILQDYASFLFEDDENSQIKKSNKIYDNIPTINNNDNNKNKQNINYTNINSDNYILSITDKKFITKKDIKEKINSDYQFDIYDEFNLYNTLYFEGKLGTVSVEWSKRMTLCAGTFQVKDFLPLIRLSEPLLKFRELKEVRETLIHEMIHAYNYVLKHDLKDDSSGHGVNFKNKMNEINSKTEFNITIFHKFYDEVDFHRNHIWRCNGKCKDFQPYFGYVKRAMNRAPSKSDNWWGAHQKNCGGDFIKISQPEKKIKNKNVNNKDIKNMLEGIEKKELEKNNKDTIDKKIMKKKKKSQSVKVIKKKKENNINLSHEKEKKMNEKDSLENYNTLDKYFNININEEEKDKFDFINNIKVLDLQKENNFEEKSKINNMKENNINIKDKNIDKFEVDESKVLIESNIYLNEFPRDREDLRREISADKIEKINKRKKNDKNNFNKENEKFIGIL